MTAQPNLPDASAVDELLESLQEKYYIDSERLEYPGSYASGRGGFGEVHQAILHPANETPHSSGASVSPCETTPGHKTVAVKKLTNLHGIDDQRLKRMFAREVHVWSTASHPYILAFVGFYFDLTKRAAWLISEWEPLGNIKEYLAGGQVSVSQKLKLLHDTTQAMVFLHSHSPSICHGDIKSMNVLITRDIRAVMCDFGLARIIEDEGFKDLETPISNATFSTRWSSPELLAGERTSPESDMWAWGWLVWEVGTGKHPFPEARNTAAVCGAITARLFPGPSGEPIFVKLPPLWELTTNCWHKDPKSRPSPESGLYTLKELRNQVDQQGSMPDDGAQPIVSILREHVDPVADSERLMEFLKSKYAIDPNRLEFPDAPFSRRGGFAVVIRATLHPAGEALPSDGVRSCGNAPDHRTVAVKKLIDLDGIDPPRLKRVFTRELLVWSEVKHPNILPFIGFYFDLSERTASLISDWVPFGNIREYLRSREVSLFQKLKLLHDTAQALIYLHSHSIYHGDIKSMNVLVTGDVRAVMCDFGLARMVEDDDFRTLETDQVNTKWALRWCSPELFAGQRTGPESDIWAWGWLVWEVATGKLPFPSEPTELAVCGAILQGRLPGPSGELIFAQVPLLWQLVIKCWHKDPTSRPSASSVSQSLKELLDSLHLIPPERPPESPPMVDKHHSFRDRLRSFLRGKSRSALTQQSETASSASSARPTRAKNSQALASASVPSGPAQTTLNNLRGIFSVPSFGEGQPYLDLTPYITKNEAKARKHGGHSSIWIGSLNLPRESTQNVALRILRIWSVDAEDANNPKTKNRLEKRLQRELCIWKPLKHPQIASCLGFATVDAQPCLISPWYENGNAREYIDKNPHCDRKSIIIQVVEALIYLHGRDPPIVHRNLKPRKVLIGNDGRAMLTGFGLAKIMDDMRTGFTSSNNVAFTISYAGPEALDGGDITTRFDVFSFACLALEIMSGQAPWYDARTPAGIVMARSVEGVPPPAKYPGLPAGDPLWGILNQCWALNPNNRPSMKEVLRQLQELPGWQA